MTCEWCNGIGKLPMLDLWHGVHELRDGRPFTGHVLAIVDCPACSGADEANDMLVNTVTEKGEPFTDTSYREEGWHYEIWGDTSGHPFLVARTGPPPEEDKPSVH